MIICIGRHLPFNTESGDSIIGENDKLLINNLQCILSDIELKNHSIAEIYKTIYTYTYDDKEGIKDSKRVKQTAEFYRDCLGSGYSISEKFNTKTDNIFEPSDFIKKIINDVKENVAGEDNICVIIVTHEPDIKNVVRYLLFNNESRGTEDGYKIFESSVIDMGNFVILEKPNGKSCIYKGVIYRTGGRIYKDCGGEKNKISLPLKHSDNNVGDTVVSNSKFPGVLLVGANKRD